MSLTPTHPVPIPQGRVFAGIRATSDQHIGNYLGAINNFVDPSAPDRSRARLKLTRAAQIVLARTLGLMGVARP